MIYTDVMNLHICYTFLAFGHDKSSINLFSNLFLDLRRSNSLPVE
jgi:hypothetical protein